MTKIADIFDLTGKYALVVGGGKVACAIAALMRDAGAQVTQQCDPDLSEAGVESLFASLDRVDILVNGAVRNGPWTLDSLSMEEWDRVHGINVRGAYLLMREAVRKMQEHGCGGRLINISTIGSAHPVLHGNFAYGSSRAGTNALSRQFALDFAKDRILSNAILVGAVSSDPFPPGIVSPSGPGADPARMLGGYGSAEDVAPLALLLAGEGGRYITGQSLIVDGGFFVG